MNADERQALRERHAEEYGLCVYCFVPDTYNGRVGEWMPAVYPCDAIKVLDATEPAVTEIRASATSDVMPTNECDHLGIEEFCKCYGYSDCVCGVHEYCPVCGEEL